MQGKVQSEDLALSVPLSERDGPLGVAEKKLQGKDLAVSEWQDWDLPLLLFPRRGSPVSSASH